MPRSRRRIRRYNDMLRALIAGSDADEITDLAPRATRLFGTSCNYFAIEADQTTTDPALASLDRRLVTICG